jgi:hypothetical protein
VVPVNSGPAPWHEQPAEHHQDPISWFIDAIASVFFDVDEDVDEDGHDRFPDGGVRYDPTRLGPC